MTRHRTEPIARDRTVRSLTVVSAVMALAACGGGAGAQGTSGLDSGATVDARTDVRSMDSGADATLPIEAATDEGGVPDSAAGEAAASCAPAESQCADGGVETCGADGQWSTAAPCATGMCSTGACTGSTMTGPSCKPGKDGGLTYCGASAESCCTSLEVPGGTYFRSYDPVDADGGVTLAPDGGPANEADPATVSGFRLDKYVVTVGRFRQFVAAWNGGSGYLPPAGSGIHTHLHGGRGLANSAATEADAGPPYETGWDPAWNSNVDPTDLNLTCGGFYDTWTNTAGAQENLPMNCVNWYEAYAFCIWDGGFLPSEAEWEYAAAGGSQQREYPWGSITPGTACPGTGCEYAIYGCYYPNGSGTCSYAGPVNVAPVGSASLGAARWGHFDMAGNIWEWNFDLYATSYVNPCSDCAELSPSIDRVIRSSNFGEAVSYLIPSYRDGTTPYVQNGGYGLRCARSP